jgi:hypothetical protein
VLIVLHEESKRIVLRVLHEESRGGAAHFDVEVFGEGEDKGNVEGVLVGEADEERALGLASQAGVCDLAGDVSMEPSEFVVI